MKERLFKFIICLIVSPIIFVFMLIVAALALTLPIIALIYPDLVKIEKKSK